MRITVAAALVAICVLPCPAQQAPDPNFKFANPAPAFEAGQGPAVCIDEAHYNFHTAGGRYASFAEVAHGDGYRVEPFKEKFTAESLKPCRVMVIANATAAENEKDWAYPHGSAFTRDEINAMFLWLQGGGSLLLIVDHSPMPGASAGLGAMLGAALVDGYANLNTGEDPPDVFSGDSGGLRLHAITNGRNEKERVTAVATFTGSAFKPSWDFDLLLVLPPDAMNVFHWSLSLGAAAPPRREWPRFSVGGWAQGAARTLGKGRVVILGEAAMCSAQIAGPDKWTMGMNHPKAAQNAQFCLNTVRWLSGVLEPPPSGAH